MSGQPGNDLQDVGTMPAAPALPTAGGSNRFAPFLTLWSLITAAATLCLIVVGSFVTSHTIQANGTIVAVGDSIPTWPFGDQFNVEMLHRIVAAIVGVCALVLAFALAVSEPRKWVRRLGYLAFVAVICQALLGGVRVLFASPDKVDYNSTTRIGIAMVHATLAQLIFALTSLVALATTKGWLESPAPVASPDTKRTRRLAVLTCAMVAVQILLGAWVRHLRFVPDLRLVAVWIHVAMALSVAVHVVLLAVRTSKKHNALYAIRQTAGVVVFFVGLQIFLGIFALIMTPAGALSGSVPPDSLTDVVRGGHVATGAMILAMCLVVTARTFKLLKPAAPGAPSTQDVEAGEAVKAATGNLHREAHA